jgi:hypothetical protein
MSRESINESGGLETSVTNDVSILAYNICNGKEIPHLKKFKLN